MSKFIRTKDGIFEVRTISDEPIIDFNGKPDYEDTRAIYTTTDEKYTYYYGYQVIKEADTIEELCDGFYIDIPGRDFNSLWVYKDFASCQKAATLLEENHVKGFIKTEKGLIFVWDFSKNEVFKRHV